MADLVEKHMIELSNLVEELQEELSLLDSVRYSFAHIRLIFGLLAAIGRQVALLRRSMKRVVGE
jgi:hypothetical protein